MAKIDLVDPSGKKVGTRELPAEMFEAKVNVPLMHQVVVAALAGSRSGTQSTKTRGDVSGGGKKPWRQKGTGRSRQGSIRAPQWVGGGVSHGPQPRDHSMRVNKKMKAGALRAALSDAFATGKLVVIDKVEFEEPKTKEAAGILGALKLDGRVLVVLAQPSESGSVEKSFRNIDGVRLAYSGGLGVYDVLLADRVLFTADALDALEGKGDEA